MPFPYNLLCFDNDGTLAVSGKPIGDIVPRLNRLKEECGTRLMMLTNNSSKDDLTYKKKLEQIGFNPGAVDIVSPIAVAAEDLITQGLESGFILGNDLCIEEFARRGIRHDGQNPRFVFMAYDTTLTYEKLSAACKFVKSGLPLFQSHIDPVCPGIDVDLPDCGLMIELISVPTRTKPVKTFGKESQAYARYIRNSMLPETTAVIVGDRLHTDIALSRALGWDGVWINNSGTTLAATDPKPAFTHERFVDFLARFGY